MPLMVFSHSNVCSQGRNNLTPIPFPTGQKYLSKNNFFISSLMMLNSSTNIPLMIPSSSLPLMYSSLLCKITVRACLKPAYNLCACEAIVSIAEQISSLCCCLQYLPRRGIFSTILNNRCSMFVQQNNISKVCPRRVDSVHTQRKFSFEVQHLDRKWKQGDKNLSLSHWSRETLWMRCYSTKENQSLLCKSSKLQIVSPRIILRGFLLVLVRYLPNFFEEDGLRNSRSSCQGVPLQSMWQSRRRKRSTSSYKKNRSAFIFSLFIESTVVERKETGR